MKNYTLKFTVREQVYCINKEEQCINRGIVKNIIIEEDSIKYKLELMDFEHYTTLIVEENSIGKNINELYERLVNNIKEYFPLMWK